MKKQLNTIGTLAAAITAALAISACGGGGGGSSSGSTSSFSSVEMTIQPPAAGVNNAGTTVDVMGVGFTPNTKLANMSWSVSPSSATLSNADCASAVKNTQSFTANAQNSTGTSTWSCAVGITGSGGSSTNTVYTLTLTGTDDKGNSKSASQPITFAPAPTGTGGTGGNGLLASAGGNFTAAPASSNSLHCSAEGGKAPYTYAWSISANGGYNFPLSAYNAADTTFTAPTTTSMTNLAFVCKVTDADKFTSSSVVTATVNPTAASDLTASAGGNFTAISGSVNTMHCSANGGKTPYSYEWVIKTNGGFNFPLNTYASADTGFTAPTTTTATSLVFTCKVTDALKAVSTSDVTASINPDTLTALTADAGLNFSAAVGSTNNLNCSATGGKGPYTYQWLISSNGGYNFPLSSYNTAATSFTVPSVTAATALGFTCRATDSKNTTVSAVVTANINPAAANVNTLVTNVTQPGVASPGQTVTLDGSTSGWFTPAGVATSGPTPTYAWTSNNASVVIGSPTANKTTVTIPTSITTATTISFTLTATSGTSTSFSTVNVLVDPFGPLSLSVAPSSAVSVGNTVVSFAATATSPSGSAKIYYKWTQVSGPLLSLGGADTATLGVVPPLAAANTTYVFRVAVGYQPITASYTGLYFADTTLTVTP